MSKTKNKPGIHLRHSLGCKKVPGKNVYQTIWYWNIIASNGREIARSSYTYTRKSGAVKSIATAAMIFAPDAINNLYYDHSKKDSPLQSYL